VTGGAPLTLEGVTVAYDRAPVLDLARLVVSPGEWLAVIGPNGAGKSSLLKAVAGLAPATGSIQVGGDELRGIRPAARARRVVYVPQHPHLPAGMSVAEYVLLGRTAHLGYLSAESAEDRDQVGRVIDRLQLAHLADREIGTLSGGEAQRATLARALAQSAPVLLLDEPTSSLDLGHQVGVLELVEELRARDGLTVLCAMHDLTLAGRFADRLLLLVAGRPVAVGAPDEVLTEEVLAHHYGTPVRVIEDPDGGRIVVPLGRTERR
jgi:iron complex transport system ATP-binding protein